MSSLYRILSKICIALQEFLVKSIYSGEWRSASFKELVAERYLGYVNINFHILSKHLLCWTELVSISKTLNLKHRISGIISDWNAITQKI